MFRVRTAVVMTVRWIGVGKMSQGPATSQREIEIKTHKSTHKYLNPSLNISRDRCVKTLLFLNVPQQLLDYRR